jgi:hypothetical protein
MRFLPAVFANLLLLLAAFGLGGFLRPLLPRTFSKIDRLSIIALGGLGLLGALLFLLGLIRYSPAVMLMLLLPSGLLGIRCLLQEMRGVDFHSIFGGIPVIPASVIALVLLITIVGGFAEPVGDIRLDTISYHYLGPRVWLRDGVIRPVLDHGFTAFPATVEVQYGVLMALGGQSAPELFAAISLSLILLLTAATALRMGLDWTGAWWVAALLSAMPAVYRGLYNGMIDVIYTAFVIAAARIAFDDERPKHSALVGLFCGFAIGTKYTGLVSTVLLVITAALFAATFRGIFSRPFLRQLGTVCLVAFIVASPWYMRNWISLGCPIYPPPPLFYHFFHIKYFPLEALLRLHRIMSISGRAMGRGPLSLLMLPFNLTFHPANFESGAGGIGLVPLAFLPFCFHAYPWNQFAKMSALFAVLQTIFWFFTMQESRYLIQVYVIAAIFGVAGWRYVVRAAPRFGRFLSALTIATSISYGLFMIVVARADDVHAAVSSSFAEKRKLTEIPFLESFRYLNRDSSVGRVLILDPSIPPYYLEKSYLKLLGKYGEQPQPEASSLREVLPELSEQHITHVLDVRSDERGFQVLPGNPENLVLVFEANDQRIYRVLPPG